VSLASSIFQKPCPGCAASVAVSAARCDCGHVFESATDSLSPLEASLRDEELYEGYLAARAEQAQQVARVAEQALDEEADNPELVSAAALAREVAKSIDNDLAEQRKKIAAIQNALHKSQPVAPAPAAASVITETAIPESAVAAETPAPVPIMAKPVAPKRPVPAAASVKVIAELPESAVVTAAPAPAPKITVKPSAPARPTPAAAVASSSTPVLKPDTSVINRVKPTVTPTWQASTAQKAADVLAAIKNAKVRESLARAKNAVVAAATKEKEVVAHAPLPQPAPASSSAPSVAPPSAFRKEQASKAEKIMEAHKAADDKECPNCTSRVLVNTTRCQCGFAFVSGGNELPSLTLCTGDFTALRNSLKLNLRR
jgi:hypothetical protein